MVDNINRLEFNGLGQRVNEMGISLAKVETTLKHNQESIDRLFDDFDSKSKAFGEKADKLTIGVIVASVILVVGMFIKEMIFKG